MQVDRYSRVVGLLKVLLPLAALALLSTLFLISRAVAPPETVPFAENEVQERLLNQQVTGPYVTGTSFRGDEIAFIAEKVTSPDGTLGSNKAEVVTVEMTLANGTDVTVVSDFAEVDLPRDYSELEGNVDIVTSHGYRILSDRLQVTMSDVDILSPGPVEGTTPVGDITAGTMRFFVPEGASEPQLVFTNGVRLLYQP